MQPNVGHPKLIKHSLSNLGKSKSVMRALNIQLPKFPSFSSTDLERLKDNSKWLTDSHVTFCLLFVFISFCSVNLNGPVHGTRDSYQQHSKQNDWGNLKITLLDTSFWPKMSVEPDAYRERYRAKVDLVGYDFVVMPMFGKSVHLFFYILIDRQLGRQPTLEAWDR